jgi:hypothetical protein
MIALPAKATCRKSLHFTYQHTEPASIPMMYDN